ncbi:hypothetical protein [Hyphomicrobium sp. DY-1]|uniref:hypothetical protein n=1 Tax=Hyphomicrobium sp. DY-1 TaxID=3075650 RepID=UPI0039C34E38
MHLYRTRPVTVEAKQFRATVASASEIWAWLAEHGLRDALAPYEYPGVSSITIPTPEGPALARPGDYIVRDAAGNFFPMSQLAFEAKYESVNAEPQPLTK